MCFSLWESEKKVVHLFQFDHPQHPPSQKKEMVIKSDRKSGWRDETGKDVKIRNIYQKPLLSALLQTFSPLI